MTKVIALLGGPGVGKSTVSTGLFSELKQRKVNCEYVSEYAKDVVWEGTNTLLENQIHVFSEQFRRQFRLLNKVDYIITDSPLLLNSIYFNYYCNSRKGADLRIFDENYCRILNDLFDASFSQFDNITYLIDRKKEYNPVGRIQTEHQARGIDIDIKNKLDTLGIKYSVLNHNTEKSNISHILKDLVQIDSRVSNVPKVYRTAIGE